MADKHIGHGSQVVYKSYSSRLNLFKFLHAARIATISACEVGSLFRVTELNPSEIIFFFDRIKLLTSL